MIVLMTGSRDWTKRGPVEVLIHGMALRDPATEFVFGDCPTGLDAIALKVCKDSLYDHKKFDADWDRHGKAAGPRRNGEMVRYCMDRGEPVICYGFRTDGVSKGTDDCLEQARRGGIPTYLIRCLPERPMAVPGTKGYRYNSEVEGP